MTEQHRDAPAGTTGPAKPGGGWPDGGWPDDGWPDGAGAGVELRNVTRRFGRFEAVRGAHLSAGPGVTGLLGPNGAGKTTLLRIMATVIPPTSGTVRLLGRDAAVAAGRREIRRRLGYLPQALGYYPGFTVTEFVEYFALLKEIPRSRARPAAAEAIEQVGLGGHARSKLRTLSGGMLRRAGIAQAIVNDPLLLLLDEPTAGLDPRQRVEFRALLRQIGERAAVIVSTHLVEDVAAACDHVAMVLDGRIAFGGTTADLAALGQAGAQADGQAGAQGGGLAGSQAGGTGAAGDSPLERGYAAVLSGARP
jgi:ABC-2 type transport system ATP-binding protein